MAQQTALSKLSTDFRDWQRSWDMHDKDPRNYKKPKNFYEFIQTYLAMEKEQMYQVWLASEQWSDGEFLDSKKSFEEYYNETFKQQ
jgi:hypothetical protein